MITRIEIDGFKTFHEFSLDLKPFQVIIGPNGSGKSNLFDAIRLLSQLADQDLYTAFRSLRGEPRELFTLQPDGNYGTRMRFAVEMLVDPTVTDEWGDQEELEFSPLRYELEIERLDDPLNQLHVTHEYLASVGGSGEKPPEIFIRPARFNTLPALVFVRGRKTSGTKIQETMGKDPVLRLYLRSALSRFNTIDSAQALAVRQEMQHWGLLDLEPNTLRQPAPVNGYPMGSLLESSLPVVLFRMKSENPSPLRDVSRDMSTLVSGFREIDVERDDRRGEYYLTAKMNDGLNYPVRLLSDGTLRLLAMMTMKNDTQQRGTIMIEEPENGVHPAQLERLVRRLHEMASDIEDPKQAERPLRQLLINTHSPVLVKQLDLAKGELLFADMPTRVVPGVSTTKVTRIVPVLPEVSERSPEEAYSLTRALEYLNEADMTEARDYLLEAIRK
ncbi:MAG TPA: AAA family ATPase [Chthonomonadaceae bacterium]|nr:AAA family ATPase [Chthonomonadaceae bacterium]